MRALYLLAALAVMASLLSHGALAAYSVILENPPNGDVATTSPVNLDYHVTDEVVLCLLYINSNVAETGFPQVDASSRFTVNMPDSHYEWRISCIDSDNVENSSETRELYLDTEEPHVLLHEPSQGAMLNYSDISFSYTPSDANLINCSLMVNTTGQWARIKTVTTPQNGSKNSFYKAISDGVYLWNIECLDAASRAVTAAMNRTFTIDTTAPAITRVSPDALVTESSATIRISTGENAHCRYSTSQNATYSSMADFPITDSTSHSLELSGLLDNVYRYTVQCRDTIGLLSQPLNLDFEVSQLPTAGIHLSDDSPVRAGLIEVTLLSTSNLRQTPHLYYSYDDDATLKPISLTGSNSLWRGYIIIPDDGKRRVGTFSFSGTDDKGRTGTLITEGKIFIIDTFEPGIPINVRAEGSYNGSIKLSWFFDSLDLDHYQIYRATRAGVNFVDLYRNSNNTVFIDTATADKVTYFYSVAAVDPAGNLGALSEEVYATALYEPPKVQNQSAVQEPALQVLPPGLVPRIDTFQDKVDQLSFDIDQGIESLERNIDENKRQLLQEFMLVQKLEDSKAEVGDIRNEADALKQHYRTETELEAELSRLGLRLSTIERTTMSDITVSEQAQYMQGIKESDILDAVNYFLANEQMAEKEKQDYIAAMQGIQSSISIEVRIKMVAIEYLDGSKQRKTYFEKRISNQVPESMHDVIVIETIPKSIAGKSSDLELITTGSEVLEEDPVLKWGFFTLDYNGQAVKYSIDRHVLMEDAKKTKTVVLLGPMQVKAEQPQVTGFSIRSFLSDKIGFSLGSIGFILFGMLVIAGLSVYYIRISKASKEVQPASFTQTGPVQESKAFTVPQAGMSSSIESDFLYFKFLVNQAGFYARQGDKERLTELYPKISTLYRGLPKHMKAMVYQDWQDVLGRRR